MSDGQAGLSRSRALVLGGDAESIGVGFSGWQVEAKRARRGAIWAALVAVGVACLGFGGGIGFWLAGH